MSTSPTTAPAEAAAEGRSKRGPSEDKADSDAKRARPAAEGEAVGEDSKVVPAADAAPKENAPDAAADAPAATDGAAPPPAAVTDTPVDAPQPVPQPLPTGTAITDEQIHALVQEREKFRAAKDWDSADRIREQLRGYGVEVSDSDKTWRSNDGRTGAIMLGSTQAAAGGGCTLTDEQINAKLTEREEARKMRDYFSGDRIRDELRAQGCEVDDRDKVWRTTDGRRGRVGGGPAPVPFSPSSAGGGGGGQDIEALIQERQMARDRKDYAKSDALREQLRAMGVQVHDTEGTWHSSDGRSGSLTGGPTMGGSMMGGGMGGGMGGAMAGFVPGGPLNDQQINALMAQREQARSMKDWTTGDRIRDQLRSSGVTIFDREKTWQASDGRQGVIGGVGAYQAGGGLGGGYQQPQMQMQQQQHAAYYQQMQAQYTPEQIAAYQQYYAAHQQA